MASTNQAIQIDCSEMKQTLLDFEAAVLRARQEEAQARRTFWLDVLNTRAVEITAFFLGATGAALAVGLAYAVLGQ